MATPWLEALRRRDPRGVALRRAARVAVAVPVSLVVLQRLPGTGDADLFGVFATLALLVFADFGGPLRTRAAAYLATIAVAVPILWVGVVLGQSTLGAVLVMAVVALLLGIAAVLRGELAAAQSTLLLGTVLAVTSAPAGSQWSVVWSWIAGGLLATAAALLLWPARPSRQIRVRAGRVFTAGADAVRLRWATSDRAGYLRAVATVDESLATLHGGYDGNLMRPSGLTTSDRSLAEVVDLAGRLRRYLRWIDVTPADVPPDPALQVQVAAFADVVADQLAAIGRRLAGESVTPSPERVQQARQEQLTAVAQWAEEARGRIPAQLVRQRIDDVFPLRLTSISAELAAASVEGRSDFSDRTLGVQWERQVRRPFTKLRVHVSWDSPWFRNALRAAVALSISVGVAKTLALGHEFWIVLGTLTALRFDALGTGRTVVQALLGTSVGVGLASVLIVLFADQQAVWWVLLPITLFVCAFTPGAFSLAYGQAAFSVAVLVLFSLLFPAGLQLAELRLVEVFIGLCVSLLVSLVMWPRGVVATLYRRMREAMAAATDHLVMAIDHLAGGGVDHRILTEYARQAEDALDRAQENYDLAVAAKPPTTVPLHEWARVALASWHVHVAAYLLPGVEHIVSTRGSDRVVPAELVGPMLDASHDMRDRLQAAVASWQHAPQRGSVEPDEVTWPASADVAFTMPASVQQLRAGIVTWLAADSDWSGSGPDPRPVTVSWIGDWIAFIAWSAELLHYDLAMARRAESAASSRGAAD